MEQTTSQMKTYRVLSIYERLRQGQIIHKKQEAARFQVNEKTIQRDIEEIRTYLSANHSDVTGINLVYRKHENGYVLQSDQNTWLMPQEVVTVGKILLESRALSKTDMTSLLEKLLVQSDPAGRHRVNQMIRNELHHYTPVRHIGYLLDTLWDLSVAIQEHRFTVIQYQRVGQTKLVSRCLQPVGILFSEYYFYLLAYIDGKGYEFPTVYRIDAIAEYDVLEDRFRAPEQTRFEEGEFRKRVQFMQTGRLEHVEFRFWGASLDAMLDRLPNAQIIHQDESGSVLQATVFGRGIKMWLLSQAQYVEVLSPPDFRREFGETIREMFEIYKR